MEPSVCISERLRNTHEKQRVTRVIVSRVWFPGFVFVPSVLQAVCGVCVWCVSGRGSEIAPYSQRAVVFPGLSALSPPLPLCRSVNFDPYLPLRFSVSRSVALKKVKTGSSVRSRCAAPCLSGRACSFHMAYFCVHSLASLLYLEEEKRRKVRTRCNLLTVR